MDQPSLGTALRTVTEHLCDEPNFNRLTLTVAAQIAAAMTPSARYWEELNLRQTDELVASIADVSARIASCVVAEVYGRRK